MNLTGGIRRKSSRGREFAEVAALHVLAGNSRDHRLHAGTAYTREGRKKESTVLADGASDAAAEYVLYSGWPDGRERAPALHSARCVIVDCAPMEDVGPALASDIVHRQGLVLGSVVHVIRLLFFHPLVIVALNAVATVPAAKTQAIDLIVAQR